MKRFTILILLLLVSCQSLPTQPALPIYPTWVVEAEPVSVQPGLNVTVDPRMELLAVIQSLGKYDEQTQLITDYKFPYQTDIAEYFQPYRDHTAVKIFDQMSQVGFTFDAPPTLMLYLTNPPELAVTMPFENVLVARAGGPTLVEAFLIALRDFARETSFMTFYTAHADFYDTMTGAVEAMINPTDLTMLEDYYGMQQHSYNIILVPLFHAGGFGPRMPAEPGMAGSGVVETTNYDVYSINGPHGITDTVPTFGNAADYRELIWHEFSHSFINPLTTANSDLVFPYEKLAAPITLKMKRMAYTNWETIVNEHVIRAITARLVAQADGEEAGQAFLAANRKNGFRYIDVLSERLQEYEANRSAYSTLESFYRSLMEVWVEESEK
jgi:hypothetical protein